jgi:hypothetical protein
MSTTEERLITILNEYDETTDMAYLDETTGIAYLVARYHWEKDETTKERGKAMNNEKGTIFTWNSKKIPEIPGIQYDAEIAKLEKITMDELLSVCPAPILTIHFECSEIKYHCINEYTMPEFINDILQLEGGEKVLKKYGLTMDRS